jgi:hypothetical protein
MKELRRYCKSGRSSKKKSDVKEEMIMNKKY